MALYACSHCNIVTDSRPNNSFAAKPARAVRDLHPFPLRLVDEPTFAASAGCLHQHMHAISSCRCLLQSLHSFQDMAASRRSTLPRLSAPPWAVSLNASLHSYHILDGRHIGLGRFLCIHTYVCTNKLQVCLQTCHDKPMNPYAHLSMHGNAYTHDYACIYT